MTRQAYRKIANRPYTENEVIQPLEYKLVDTVTYATLQIGINKHAHLTDELAYLNHSCEPNCYVSDDLKLIASRSIAESEEMTICYLATEWDMDEKFECLCNSVGCMKEVQGAKYANAAVLKRYKLMRHIKDLLHDRNSE